MTTKQLELEIKLAVNAHILKKSLRKLIINTLGYTALVFIGFILLLQIGKPSRFPFFLPIAILFTYPLIWYVTLKDAKDTFYNRDEEEKFADIESIWNAYKENKSTFIRKLAIAYEFFTMHSKSFIFLTLLMILIVLLSK